MPGGLYIFLEITNYMGKTFIIGVWDTDFLLHSNT